MSWGFYLSWGGLLALSLVYLGLGYRRQGFRFWPALGRLAVLGFLLLLARFLPHLVSPERPSLFILIDTSKSLQATLGRTSLEARLGPWLQQHYTNYEWHFYDLYDFEHELQLTQLDERFPWRLESPILQQVQAFLHFTQPPSSSRVLLVSDGRDTQTEVLSPALRQSLAKEVIPLDTLVLEPPPALNELTLEKIENPHVVFLKTAARLPVTIQARLSHPQSSTLMLTDGQTILTKQELTFPAGESQQEAELSWIPTQIGENLLYLRLASVKDEQNLQDNVAYLPLSTRAQRLRLLHVAGRPSWDVKQLRTLLREIPEVDLISFYILRDPFQDYQNLPEGDISLIQFPTQALFLNELFKFDAVIFHNFAIQQYLFNPEYQQSFQRYLKGGKRIIVIGGEQVYANSRYQQLFLRPGSAPLPLRFGEVAPAQGLRDPALAQAVLPEQPSFPALPSPEIQQEPFLYQTHFQLGEVNWLLNPFLWRWQYTLLPQQIGQSGAFAAFWQTLLYQRSAEATQVFRDFQPALPYTKLQPLTGTLQVPQAGSQGRNQVRVQLIDQLLNTLVNEQTLALEGQHAYVHWPAQPASTYELMLSCDCPEMAEMKQTLTVVEDWLELRHPQPNRGWLQELSTLTQGLAHEALR